MYDRIPDSTEIRIKWMFRVMSNDLVGVQELADVKRFSLLFTFQRFNTSSKPGIYPSYSFLC